MNHHLTLIAALPTTAGSGSALIPERNPSRPRFELTEEDMAAAGYPVAVPASAEPKEEPSGPAFMPPIITHNFFITARREGKRALEELWLERQRHESTGIYSYEQGGIVGIGDAPPVAPCHTNKPSNVVEHSHFIYSQEDDRKRFDACALADGRFVVWDAWRDRLLTGCLSFEQACEFAAMLMKKEMARAEPQTPSDRQGFEPRDYAERN